MPRFFFPASLGVAAEPDLDGVELADVAEARDSAVRALVEMARDVLDGESNARVLTIEVLDEHGQSHFRGRLTFEPDAASEPR